MEAPRTLQEVIVYFADYENCHNYLVSRRWPNGVSCPRCGGTKVLYQAKYRRFQCGAKHELRQFTLKTGTIFEDSPVGLDKWLPAMWQIVNCKNGISSYEVHRAIGVSQKTAWFMDHRIRFALHSGSFEAMLSGHCEADETFIGQKSRNMHKGVRAAKITGTGTKDKTAVMGILERGKDGKQSKVRTSVLPNRKKHAIQSEVRKHIQAGSALYTDALLSYEGLAREFAHGVVDHAVQYVDGQIHTNGLENYWSLLKRTIAGTYVSVEPFHLFRYLDEQAWRYNNRKDDLGEPINDGQRFDIAVREIVGKRLTWDRLTGKTDGEPLEVA
ncbi:MAG TPA: IS1595 family transposase [Bryobacteraceae bacterium]|jgi:transposase-like protein|nr:IS1595 family transposase [Bryobacteraceae bacterium]